MRQRLIEHLQGLIEGSDAWPKRQRDEFVGSLKHKPGLRRLVRRTKTGLLRTSDPTLTAQDLAAAYKRLIAVERGWRALLLIRVAQRSALTGDQKTILAALDLPEPPKYLDFTPFAAHPAG